MNYHPAASLKRSLASLILTLFFVFIAGTFLTGCGETSDSASLATLDPDAQSDPLLQYTASSLEPAFFVHISDTHIGESGGHGKEAMKTLLKEVVPVIKPLATIHTGDIVDEGMVEESWRHYKDLFTVSTVKYPQYVDILGNHDAKQGTDWAEDWLFKYGRQLFDKYSQTKDRYGFTELKRSGLNPVRLIRTNTADSPTNNNRQNINGYFPSDQLDSLLNHPDKKNIVDFSVVLGHSPVKADYKELDWNQSSFSELDDSYMDQITEGNGRMKELIDAYNAPIYLSGHVHQPGLEWLKKKTLVVRADDFGKNSTNPKFYLVAYDGESTADRHAAAKLVKLDTTKSPSVKWPVVFITTPANSSLGNTDSYYGNTMYDGSDDQPYNDNYIPDNPNAKAFTTDQTVTLRAMVFSPEEVTSVKYQIDDVSTSTPRLEFKIDDVSTSTPLANVRSTNGRVWGAGLSFAGLSKGKHTVKVTATRTNGDKGTDTISFTVK